MGWVLFPFNAPSSRAFGVFRLRSGRFIHSLRTPPGCPPRSHSDLPSMHRRSTPGRVLGTQGEPNTEVGVGSEDSASRGREPSTSHQEPQPLGPLRPLPSPPPRSEALALSGVSETFFPPEASFSTQRRGFQVCYVMTISPLGGHYCNRDGPRQTLP